MNKSCERLEGVMSRARLRFDRANARWSVGELGRRTALALQWLLALATAFVGTVANAQVPANPYEYSRTSSFTYDTNGLLKSETVEPNSINSCAVTTYTYDAYGNKSGATVANCSGTVATRQQFASRTTTSDFDPASMPAVSVRGTSVVAPLGAFPIVTTNALAQSETKEYDPRFGAVIELVGPNGLPTNWTLDDFGRKVLEIRPDGIRVRNFYCFVDGSTSDTPGCPAPVAGEAPADAATFVHSDTTNSQGAVIGGYSRVYSDRLGRVIRRVSQSFDGSGQTTALQGVPVVQDTVYNAHGAKIIETEPYFLSTGSSTAAGVNDVGATLSVYDALGRVTDVYVADPHGSVTSQVFGASTTAVTYGKYGSRRAAKTSSDYLGLKVTISNDKNQQRIEERNTAGQVARVTDANGAQLSHRYDAFGNMVATRDALQNLITLKFDIRGRKVELDDPDAGLWKYDYNALGELVWQQSPNQRAATVAGAQQTTMAYDVLGRMIQRVEPEGTTSWSYDKYADASACAKGVGKLCEVKVQRSATEYFRRKFAYDTLGRSSTTQLLVNGGPSFAGKVGYDSLGRMSSQIYPTGVQVGYSYTALGFLEKLKLLTAATVQPLPSSPGGTPGASKSFAANAVLWQADLVNAWGKTELQSYGNGVDARARFEAYTGRTTQLDAGVGTATTVLKHTYGWDSLDNLVSRADHNGEGNGSAVTETFKYGDQLNRLTEYTVSGLDLPAGSRKVTLQYNALGMLLYKSDVGVYSYGTQGSGSVRPHALSKLTAAGVTTYTYDANGNLIEANGGKYRSIAYNSFNLPDSQTGILGSNGTRYTWLYDENHGRLKEVRTVGGAGSMAGTRTTWNLHPDNAGGLGFETEINEPLTPSAANPSATTHRHFLTAGGRVIGVLVTSGALPAVGAGSPTALASVTLLKMEFWHKDHLGSLVATTDHNGSVTARYAYDPFGKRRMTNGVYDATGNLVIDWSAAVNSGTDRGYTGHEHLDDVGIVHMNGRLFDPTLGIFMQADPMVQDPDNLQNYNRYGYCLNNPLTCTDPTGFWSLRRFLKATTKAIFLPTPRNVFNAIAAAPGQAAIDRFIMSHSWANTLGQAAATAGTMLVCGGCGGYAWTAYYTYQATGSTTAASIAVAKAYYTAQLFSAAGGAGQAYGQYGWQHYAAHAAAGCASGELNGGNCGEGALSALAGKGMTQFTGKLELGTEARFVATMVSGGTASVIGGGKFENGALTAAYGYLFNCLSHPGTCTKADQPEIRRAAAACGSDSACIQRIAIYARESGIPLPSDLSQSLKDFVDITTLPARILTPAGRLADTGIDALSAAGSAINGTSDWISTVSGEAYEMFMERALKPLNTELAGRAAAISGKIFESIVGDAVKGQKQAEQDGKKP